MKKSSEKSKLNSRSGTKDGNRIKDSTKSKSLDPESTGGNANKGQTKRGAPSGAV